MYICAPLSLSVMGNEGAGRYLRRSSVTKQNPQRLVHSGERPDLGKGQDAPHG